jgi:peptidoglycan/LPS O-acetylase OafA/YrhL
MPTEPPQASVVFSIQYTRALAAFLVLTWHIREKSQQYGRDLFQSIDFGFAGVDVFFVISGFVMCLIYARSDHGLTSLLSFWRRRFLRIVPFYWLLTLVALLIFLVAPAHVNSSGGETSVPRSFLLIPGKQKFLIQNGWTLSYEMYFYLIFSLAFLVRKKAAGALMVCALIGALIVAGSIEPGIGAFLGNPLLAEFAAGSGIYFLWRHLPMERGWPVGLALSTAGLAALCFTPEIQARLSGEFFPPAGIAATCLILGMVLCEGRIRLRPVPWLEKLGDSSYSSYLFHPFALAAAGIAFQKLHLSARGTPLELVYWIGVLLFVLWCSYQVHRLVENPLIRLCSSLTGSKSPAGLPVPS